LISVKLILKLILKRFSILILYTYRNDRVKKLTETVIEMTLETDTEIICLPFSACGMLSHGRRNRMSTSLEMRVRLKLNAKALA